MLIYRFAFQGAMLLLLFGAHLAFFLLPPYMEYAPNALHLGVDLFDLLVEDPVTNIGVATCVLYPIPRLCPIGSTQPIPLYSHAHNMVRKSSVPIPIRSIRIDDPTACRCFTDSLVGQHVFFGQLGYALRPTKRIIEFLDSSSLRSVASLFYQGSGTVPDDGELDEEVGTALAQVDSALDVARRAVTKLVIDAEYSVYHARFIHHVVYSTVKIADFVHDIFSFLDPVDTDATLRRLIMYVVPVTMTSAKTISKDAATAIHAMDALLDAFSVDALEALLRAHSSFIDRCLAILHCAMSSSTPSPVCLAVELMLHNAGMIESMRDDLLSLKDVVQGSSEDLGGYLACASAPHGCTLGAASQILAASESYLVGWGKHGAISSA